MSQAATLAYDALPSHAAARAFISSAYATATGSRTAAAAGALGTATFFVLIVVGLVAIVRTWPSSTFDNTKPSAYVRHILVQKEEVALQLKRELAGLSGKALLREFHSAACSNSSHSSGAVGGALGRIGPGKMAPAFDSVVWSAPVMVLQGPVETEAGFHLILVIKRTVPVDERKKDD